MFFKKKCGGADSETYCDVATQHLHQDVWRKRRRTGPRFCFFNFSAMTMKHLLRGVALTDCLSSLNFEFIKQQNKK